MAGSGVRLFLSGEIAYAADINTYLMDQVISRFANSTARDAAFGDGVPVSLGGSGKPALSEGRFCYLDDTNEVQYYNGSTWQSSSQFTISDDSITTAKINNLAVTTAKLADNSVTSAKIVDGSVINADINASAAIAHSKLANITAGSVLLGNASNVPTATALSGDVTVGSTGVTSIEAGVIVNADINASAAIDHSKLANITAGRVLLGNASNVPTATALSGDVTVSSTGVTSISSSTITAAARTVLDDTTTAAMRTTLGVGTTDNPSFAGVTADAVQIGITTVNEIDTTAGNLVLDSAGGTTTVDDNLSVTGNIGFSGTLTGTISGGIGLPISTGVSGLGTNVATFLGNPTSANLAAAVTDETGTGSVVFSNSPTLVTPNLGTPSAIVLTNATSLPVSGLSGLGTGVATFLGTPTSSNLASAVSDETGTGSVVFSNSPTLVTPNLGTPSTLVLTNATGLPVSSGITGMGAGVGAFLATPTSANLSSAVSDETGSGSLVFANSPTLVTPNLGTPTSVNLANATNLPLASVNNLGTGVSTFLTTPTSANLRAALTDETGTGSAVFATSPTLTTPDLGTPSAIVLTNATGLPLGSVTGLGTNVSTFLATPTSANLRSALTDETGTGSAVFATSPTLATPTVTSSLSTTTTGTFDLIDSNATTVNFAGAGTTITIGATTGTTTVRNVLRATNRTSLEEVVESVVINTTALTGTVQIDANSGGIHYFTTNASADWVWNIRGDSSTTLDSIMSTGQSMTFTLMTAIGTTARKVTSLTVDSPTATTTVKWFGGTSYPSGNASSIDVYTFTVIKTNTNTFTVLASQSKFA